VAVLPDERPEDWDAHRAGILDALGPAGLLEVTLAERAALLLWRPARLARYEVATTTAALEVLDQPRPEPEEVFLPIHPASKTDAQRIGEIRKQARTDAETLRDVEAAAAVLDGFAARVARRTRTSTHRAQFFRNGRRT
jgi:hypothetical protein